MRSAVSFALLLLVASAGCSDDPPVGTLGADCPDDNNCIAPLVCIDRKCANPSPGRDAGPNDAGMNPNQDAGQVDAGMPEDAGQVDTGPVCPIPPQLSQIQARIFQPSCNQNACHGQSQAGGIRLDTPLAELRAALLGPTQDQAAPQTQLVVPGDPTNSRLYVIMSNADPPGNGGVMPPAGPLGACDLEPVMQWIADGALEN